jgi:ammonium transporter, Amt family
MSSELWAVLCAAGVLLVRAGMALHDGGSLRAKNSVSAMLRSAADFCVAVLCFWAVGGALMLCGRKGAIVGLDPSMLFGSSTESASLLFFGATLAAMCSGIVPGVLAERSRILPALSAAVCLAAIIMPISGYWAKTGWLAAMGFHDLGGASFIHVAGGLCAAVVAIAVGPRSGKYNRDGSSNAIPGHSIPLACAGGMLILAGWPLYLAGFIDPLGHRVGLMAMNALLAGSAAGLLAMVFCHTRYGKPDVHLIYASVLGGLVAISAGADAMPSWAAALVGAGAGMLVPLAILSIDLVWHVDDPSSGIAIHAVAGAWGILATGLFMPAVSAGARLKLIGVQALGLAAVCILAIAVAGITFAIVGRLFRLRTAEADEFDGLDLAEHDVGAYPDFQQTTIKSYHLREA